MEKSRPRIILSGAISIDGKIATRANDSKLSSQNDIQRLHKLRSSVDAILVGKNTVSRDNPLLTVRHVKGKNPIRIVLDSKGTISRTSKIIQSSNKVQTIIAVSKKITKKNLEKLEKFPVEIITSGNYSVNLKSLLKKLSKKKIKTILVEGGGELNWSVLKLGIVDELIVTISPRIVGGRSATTLVEGEGCNRISEGMPLKLRDVKRYANGEIILFYKL